MNIEERMKRVAEELAERQRTVHERVDCRYCLARAGEPCRSMGQPGRTPPVLVKHPHIERLIADGLYPR